MGDGQKLALTEKDFERIREFGSRAAADYLTRGIGDPNRFASFDSVIKAVFEAWRRKEKLTPRVQRALEAGAWEAYTHGDARRDAKKLAAARIEALIKEKKPVTFNALRDYVVSELSVKRKLGASIRRVVSLGVQEAFSFYLGGRAVEQFVKPGAKADQNTVFIILMKSWLNPGWQGWLPRTQENFENFVLGLRKSDQVGTLVSWQTKRTLAWLEKYPRVHAWLAAGGRQKPDAKLIQQAQEFWDTAVSKKEIRTALDTLFGKGLLFSIYEYIIGRGGYIVVGPSKPGALIVERVGETRVTEIEDYMPIFLTLKTLINRTPVREDDTFHKSCRDSLIGTVTEVFRNPATRSLVAAISTRLTDEIPEYNENGRLTGKKIDYNRSEYLWSALHLVRDLLKDAGIAVKIPPRQ